MATSEASSNIHIHGTIVDEQKKRVKCNYCAKEMTSFHRLKYHLGRVRGDVTPCDHVPTDVLEEMRKILLEKKRGYLSREVGELYHPDLPWKRNLCPNPVDLKPSQPEFTQPSVSGNGMPLEDDFMEEDMKKKVLFPPTMLDSHTDTKREEKPDLLNHPQRLIGKFFYETGIDFSAAKSPSFQRMIDATIGHGSSLCKVPSSQDLKGWILEEELKEINQYVKEVKHSWASTGCTILLDGWMDEKGRNLVTFLVDCPAGPIFLRSTKCPFNDANAVQLLLDGVIKEIGSENVVQIMTYTTSRCMEAVGKQLMERHRTIFWTVCASHCIDLILERITKMDTNKGILKSAMTITKFIYNHEAILKLMRKYTEGKDLIKSFRIRSAMNILTLETIVSQKENLKNMFCSTEWNTSIWAYRTEGKLVADLVGDPSFWSGATMVLKASIPLVRVLCLIDKEERKPQMGYIYETMDQAKEAIKREFKDKKAKYLPFWQIIDEIWDNQLHSPLHSAGYFLNPSLFYSSDFYADAEVASGLLCCIVRMVEDRHVQDLISLQLDEYREAKGPFGYGSAIEERSEISPAQWWSSYGGQCPELQKLAIRILSQTSNGASRYGLKRNLSEKLHTNGRNCIEQKRLCDLTFVHYNLWLRQRMWVAKGINNNTLIDEFDPMNDWVVEEEQDCTPLDDDSPLMDCDYGNRNRNAEGSSSFKLKEEPR